MVFAAEDPRHLGVVALVAEHVLADGARRAQTRRRRPCRRWSRGRGIPCILPRSAWRPCPRRRAGMSSECAWTASSTLPACGWSADGALQNDPAGGRRRRLLLERAPTGRARRRPSDWCRNCAVTWVRLYSRGGLTLRITEIRSAGLRHGTPEGGWANEIRPDDCVHTLIAVFTDEGITGWGSAFTNDELVRGALQSAGAAVRGRESAGAGAGERETACEHILDGPRRIGHPRHQRNRHRDVGHPRQGHRPTGRAAAGRAIPRSRAAVCVAPDARASRTGRATCGGAVAGLSRFQDRMGTVRADQLGDGRGNRARGARCGFVGLAADGGCGRERCILAAGL